MLHPFALEITTYATVTGDEVELVSCSAIADVPLLALSLIPVSEPRVHENEVPVVALASVYPKIDPLQIAGGVSGVLNCGVGLMTTEIACGALQPFDVRL